MGILETDTPKIIDLIGNHTETNSRFLVVYFEGKKEEKNHSANDLNI